MRNRRIAALGALALLAAGCASDGFYGAAGAGYAANSPLARDMGAREEAALAQAFTAAVEEAAPGERRAWASGAYSGAVTPGAYLVGNLTADPHALLPVAAPLDFAARYETELGLYALTGRANLRAGPSLKARILATLDAGTGVEVVGRVAGAPWMLVATGGKVRGYVHESLMIRAPGAELMLAGGPTKEPVLCRAFEQSLTAYGRTDRWSGAACKRGGEWRIEPTPETAPALLN